MTTIRENDVNEQAAPRTNVLDMGDKLLVNVYVHKAQLRSLVGRVVSGIEPHPSGGGRMRPTYAVDADGKTVWLNKWFAFEIDKVAGIYDLSARAVDANTDEVHIENTHIKLSQDESGKWVVEKLTYPQLIAHFGGEPMRRNTEGDLVLGEATPMSV